MSEDLHLAGSINYTLVTHVRTPFVYILQHDLPFRRYVEHTTLIETMRPHPDILFNVRFRLHNFMKASRCSSGPRNVTQLRPFPNGTGYEKVKREVHYKGDDLDGPDFNGLQLHLTKLFSDNNHLTTREYYLDILWQMTYLHRPMEEVLQGYAKNNCRKHGQQMYGSRADDEPYIYHLDGRERYGANQGVKSNPFLRGEDPLL